MKNALSFLFGMLLVSAFAPLNLWFFAFLSPLGLLFLIQPKKFVSFKKAFQLGLSFGVGFFSFGASWIFISIHTYSNTPWYIAGLITFLFVLALAFFTALHTCLTTRFSPKFIFISFPALGALFEWARSWFLSGFPWLLIGQSQTQGFFKGWIPLLGVYGLGFLILFSSTLLFIFLRERKKTKGKIAGILFLLILLSGYSLSFVNWTYPLGKAIKVSLLQGNIPQETKWNAQSMESTLKIYLDLTKQSWESKLIFWPEGAVTLPFPESQKFLHSLSLLAQAHRAFIVLGLPVQATENFYFQTAYYNAILALNTTHNFYAKRHLVPFGEYFPPFISVFRGLIGFFDIPMSDFISGSKKQNLIEVDNIKIGTFICYEIAYSNLLFDTLKQYPDVLATLSNDTWFGHSLAPYQHAQISQFAAIQTGRYLLLNANSGLTAIYDPHGLQTQVIPLFVRERLNGEFFVVKGETPWCYYGAKPILIFFIVLLACIVRRRT